MAQQLKTVTLMLLLVSGLAQASVVRITGDKPHPKFANEPILPIPLEVELDQKQVELGRMLFSDPRLSADNTIACSSCHRLDNAGVDSLVVSIGIGGASGQINAPTVYNSGLSFAQFWDGRVRTLEEQVDFPLTAKHEMGSNWQQVIAKLKSDESYSQLFAASFDGGVTPDTVRKAIASYERSLITPNSRFDQFLRGDESALSALEKEGYTLFKSYGCSSCHQGVAIGANMFEKMGVLRDYFQDRGQLKKIDLGHFNATGKEEHKHMFKVPSLRNIALTAPYFHDGSAATLGEAVNTMARYQLGRSLSKQQEKAIVAFLQTLTGEFRP